jgi:hypothetical protein
MKSPKLRPSSWRFPDERRRTSRNGLRCTGEAARAERSRRSLVRKDSNACRWLSIVIEERLGNILFVDIKKSAPSIYLHSMRTAVVAVTLLFISSVGSAVEFKGNQLGGDLLSFLRKHDRPVPAEPGMRAPSVLPGTFGSIRVTVNVPFENLRETAAGVPADIVYLFVSATAADWELLKSIPRHRTPEFEATFGRAAAGARLGLVMVSFSSDHYSHLVTALTQKYGTPDEPEEEAGTGDDRETISWTREGHLIRASKESSISRKSVVSFSSIEVMAHLTNLQDGKAKQAAADL